MTHSSTEATPVTPNPSDSSTPLEHQNVPQAHQGLHDFLYSAADEHAANEHAANEHTADTSAPLTDRPITSPTPIQPWCDETEGNKIAGVYAVFDRNKNPQFISYSRNIALSLRSHLSQKGPDTCALMTLQPFKFPKRDAMEQLRDEWIAQLPSLPPGNQDGTWARTVREAATQAMSPTEREAYEAKKLKLRRAMADGTLNKDAIKTAAEHHSTQQHQDLAAAMNDDNWSAVVREQTQQTQEN